MDIAAEIINQEKSPEAKLRSPIWNLRMDPAMIDQPHPTHTHLNPKDQLSKALGSKGVKIEYREAAPETKDKENKLPLFTVGVYLTGWDEKDKQIGVGRANGKKEAGMKAAEMALNNKKLMKVYMDKKKAREALAEKEEEALAKLGSS
jgi:ribonuclease-3